MKSPAMTLNEKLYLSGLMSDFEKAIKKNRKEDAVGILLQIDIEKIKGSEIVKTILNNKKKYGF